MSQIVSTSLASNSLALGVSRDYADAYKKAEGSPLDGNMSLLVKEVEGKSDHWKGAYFESAPIPRLWRKGEEVAGQGFRDVGWTIYVDEWEQKVTWRWTDAQDDQTSTLVDRAQDAGKGWWQRTESIIVQMLTASTDINGLSSVPNAADGVAAFSATDGASADRYGVVGGNILTGQSFSSGIGLRAAFMAARVRFMKMQDTVGQPLFSNVKEFFILGSADDALAFNECFDQKTVAQSVAGATSNAGVSNVLLDAGYTVNYMLTPRISSGTMFIVHKGAKTKPIVLVNRSAPQEIPIRMENSDEARKTGIEGTQFISRTGFGFGVCYGIMKVTT